MMRIVLQKAEGGRGGHIIAHTKSGKPIYESRHARYASMNVHKPESIGDDAKRVDGSFASYSPADHEDAASAHWKQAYQSDFGKKTPTEDGKRHLRAALAHNRLANTFAQKSLITAEENDMHLNKGGAGSRGGKIIGTSRSGKPIYAVKGAGSKAYESFDASEHTQAAKAHHAESHNPALTPNQALAHRAAAVGHQRAANELRANTKIRHAAIQANHASLTTQKSFHEDTTMNSIDIFKSFLAKGKFASGNIADAETVDGLDAELTGESSKGKGTSGPGGFTDQEDENKKVKKKVDKNAKNGGPTKSVAEQTGFNESDVGEETPLNNVGPYDIGADVTANIGEAAPTKVIDDNILRSEEQGDLTKGGEGTRGGKIVGHTKSGKAIYGSKGERAAALSAKANAFRPQNEKENRAAMNAHQKASDAHGELETPEGERLADAHQNAARYYEDRIGQYNKSFPEGDLTKGGEGTRGGKIIGHTRSGKPIYGGAVARNSKYKDFSYSDHLDAALAHKDKAQELHQKGKAQEPHLETLRSEGKEVQPHHADAYKHSDRALSHERAASAVTSRIPGYHAEQGREKTREKPSYVAKSDFYLASDAKSYEQVIEQRGFVTHVTGGLDAYLAKISKGQTFWTNGAETHPGDANSIGQAFCKSCNHSHPELYTVCPNCNAGPAMHKSYHQSQNHHGVFGMAGREQGSKLVDMSRFSLDD